MRAEIVALEQVAVAAETRKQHHPDRLGHTWLVEVRPRARDDRVGQTGQRWGERRTLSYGPGPLQRGGQLLYGQSGRQHPEQEHPVGPDETRILRRREAREDIDRREDGRAHGLERAALDLVVRVVRLGIEGERDKGPARLVVSELVECADGVIA